VLLRQRVAPIREEKSYQRRHQSQSQRRETPKQNSTSGSSSPHSLKKALFRIGMERVDIEIVQTEIAMLIASFRFIFREKYHR
jgi:hypothetical protein